MKQQHVRDYTAALIALLPTIRHDGEPIGSAIVNHVPYEDFKEDTLVQDAFAEALTDPVFPGLVLNAFYGLSYGKPHRLIADVESQNGDYGSSYPLREAFGQYMASCVQVELDQQGYLTFYDRQETLDAEKAAQDAAKPAKLCGNWRGHPYGACPKPLGHPGLCLENVR